MHGKGHSMSVRQQYAFAVMTYSLVAAQSLQLMRHGCFDLQEHILARPVCNMMLSNFGYSVGFESMCFDAT